MLGKDAIFIDPWGITQLCNKCLSWVSKELGDREHICTECRDVIDRDVNSALLIKRSGILSCPPSDGGLSLAELEPLPFLREMVSNSNEAGSPRL